MARCGKAGFWKGFTNDPALEKKKVNESRIPRNREQPRILTVGVLVLTTGRARQTKKRKRCHSKTLLVPQGLSVKEIIRRPPNSRLKIGLPKAAGGDRQRIVGKAGRRQALNEVRRGSQEETIRLEMGTLRNKILKKYRL